MNPCNSLYTWDELDNILTIFKRYWYVSINLIIIISFLQCRAVYRTEVYISVLFNSFFSFPSSPFFHSLILLLTSRPLLNMLEFHTLCSNHKKYLYKICKHFLSIRKYGYSFSPQRLTVMSLKFHKSWVSSLEFLASNISLKEFLGKFL